MRRVPLAPSIFLGILLLPIGAQLRKALAPSKLLRRAQAALEGTDVCDVAYAAEALAGADAWTAVVQSTVCEGLARHAPQADALEDLGCVAYGAKIADCSGNVLSAEQVDVLRSSLAASLSPPDLDVLAPAVLGMASIDHDGVDEARITDVLQGLVHPEGVKATLADDGSHAFGRTRKAITALKALGKRNPYLAQRLARVLSGGSDTSLDHDPSLYADLRFLGMETPTPSKLAKIAEEVVGGAGTRDMQTLSGVVRSLQYMEGLGARGPVVISVPHPVVPYDEGSKVTVRATTIAGTPLSIGSASVTHASQTTPLAVEGGEAAVPVTQLFQGPDAADVQVEVAVEGGSGSISLRVPVRSTTSATITSLAAGFSPWAEADDEDEKMEALRHPATFQRAHEGSAFDKHYFHVIFELQYTHPAPLPQQAFLRFSHRGSGLDTFFVAGGRKKGDLGNFHFEASVPLAEEMETFLHRSGSYSVSLLVGDAALADTLVWELGEVSLVFPAKAKKVLPLYQQQLQYDSDTTTAPLEEKAHTFRPPPQTPPTLLSIVAAVVATLPSLTFWLLAGPITKTQTKNATMVGRAFLACLAGVFGLFGAYWFSVPLVDRLEKLIFWMMPVGAATVVSGYQTLRSLLRDRKSGKK